MLSDMEVKSTDDFSRRLRFSLCTTAEASEFVLRTSHCHPSSSGERIEK